MAEIAKTHQDQLARIKTNVRNSYEGFKHNYDRFNEFRRFIFETSLTSDDISLLTSLSKPQMEFNITEPYISRLMGEFYKQEPSISVSAEDQDKADPLTIHVVEQHLRHILRDSKNHHTRWEIMKDLYSGGFSVGKIWTDYKKMSFDQNLNVDRVFDPCLCGFDQLARYSHKGDGRFCFELFPYDIDTFKEMPEFKDVDTNKLSFSRQFSSFNWSYLNGNEKIILVCDYYEKKPREVKIVQLANNQVMTVKEYEEMQESWGDIMQVPAVKGKSRWETIDTVCRYRCIETEVIEYKETDFTFLPLIFFDGNSVMIKNPKTSGAVKQMTRPYVYHAKGAQKLKNFTGITLANEIENMVQHKFLVAKEALPKEMDWLAAYKDVQKPSVLVYNSFFEQNPDQPIANPIREVQRVPTPPEVIQTFSATDSLIQNILGSYDSSLGINDNQLSGVAIVEAATQSNAAAMPYIVGFLQGLNRVAEVLIDLIPKYYTTPRTIPIMGTDGKAEYVKINQENGVDMKYDTNVLNVKVEAGPSYQIQKSRALQQLISLMGTSPQFDQFMNERGLPVLLDNIEIRGIDELKMLVDDWLKEQAQIKQQAMQQQQQQAQNNPVVMRNQIEMAKVQQKSQSDQGRLMVDMQQLKNDQLKTMTDLSIAKNNNLTQMIKAQTEKFSKQIDLALRMGDMKHTHAKETVEVLHKVSQPKTQPRMEANY
jgi:hypothetical protein